jgi:branched-chain amino acid transport system permease protein
MGFFLETIFGGLMAGMLYALVALGFVLIFKASGVFNFAQGAMVLFAALAMARFAEWLPQVVRLPEHGAGRGARLHAAAACMVVVAWLIERLALRRLVNQEGITLLMATLGISYVLDGAGQLIFGSATYKIDMGMPKDPLMVLENVFEGGLLLSKEDLYAAVIAAALVVALTLFFQKTGTGRALRAVADDHQAAQSIGIPLARIWVIVWSMGGIVALVAGMIWGSKLGVQFSISLVALKAFPVVILGGLTSVPGAILGGLIIGTGEKVSEIYLGPFVGGGIENWFAYVLALAFRAAGQAAGPVRRQDHRPRLKAPPCSTEKTANSRAATAPTSRCFRWRRTAGPCWPSLAIAFVAVPLLASDYSFRAVLIPFLILALAAIGLNILVGYCGQISLGTGAFMAVGAYAAYNLQVRIEGMPLLVALMGGGLAPRWSGCCSAFPACASAGCTWRWPRWPRSSSWTGSPTA